MFIYIYVTVFTCLNNAKMVEQTPLPSVLLMSRIVMMYFKLHMTLLLLFCSQYSLKYADILHRFHCSASYPASQCFSLGFLLSLKLPFIFPRMCLCWSQILSGFVFNVFFFKLWRMFLVDTEFCVRRYCLLVLWRYHSLVFLLFIFFPAENSADSFRAVLLR